MPVRSPPKSNGAFDYAIVTDFQTGAAKAAPAGKILAHNSVRHASMLAKQGAKGFGFLPLNRRDYGSFASVVGVWI